MLSEYLNRICFSRLLLPLLLAFPTSCEPRLPPGGFLDPRPWAAELDLRVGSIDEADQSWTRIRNLTVSPSGRIYTVHGQEQLVRSFDLGGSLLRVIGRRGEGPGEFRNVGNVGWMGDTLWVFDYHLYRFSLFSEAGDFLYSFRVPLRGREDERQPRPPRAEGLLFDGTVHGSPLTTAREIVNGTVTHHIVYLMSRDGAMTDSVISIPLTNSQWAVSDPENRRPGMLHAPQPFGDSPLWGFIPNERALAVFYREAPSTDAQATAQLLKLTLSGDTVFSRVFSYPPEPLRRKDVENILDNRVAEWRRLEFLRGTPRARLRRLAERSLFAPPFLPPASEMVIGTDGSFWLRGNPVSRESVPWFVLDASGFPVGQVTLPAEFRLLAADSSAAWGTETDLLGVCYLMRFKLIRDYSPS